MFALNQFENQQYLNLETFRKNGESMKTPVWFVEDGGLFYISTMANSGKVKRIRNNNHVNIAPCKMNGNVSGAWVSAKACEIADSVIISNVNRLLNKKYGLMKKLFDSQHNKNGGQSTILEIKLIG
jgi:PPOX class probable F420-dependent enzyme